MTIMKTPTPSASVARAPARRRGVGPGAKHEERGLDQTADEVITGRRTRLRLQEVVIDDVDTAPRERDPGKTRLGEGGCRDACRGSLSRFHRGMSGGRHRGSYTLGVGTAGDSTGFIFSPGPKRGRPPSPLGQ